MSKDLNLSELQELVYALAWNDGFGCYTRAGFEKLIWPQIKDRARWIVYFDIDGMHALNERFGSYEPVDAMIKQVLAIVRTTDYVAGQWKSGDEFLVCIAEDDSRDQLSDPQGMAERLMAELKKQGLSATFAIVPVISEQLFQNVKPAVDKVYAAKKQGDRGSVR